MHKRVGPGFKLDLIKVSINLTEKIIFLCTMVNCFGLFLNLSNLTVTSDETVIKCHFLTRVHSLKTGLTLHSVYPKHLLEPKNCI